MNPCVSRARTISTRLKNRPPDFSRTCLARGNKNQSIYPHPKIRRPPRRFSSDLGYHVHFGRTPPCAADVRTPVSTACVRFRAGRPLRPAFSLCSRLVRVVSNNFPSARLRLRPVSHRSASRVARHTRLRRPYVDYADSVRVSSWSCVVDNRMNPTLPIPSAGYSRNAAKRSLS